MYVVGERGPEIFVPGQSGSIIPNHAIPTRIDGGGGTRITAANSGMALHLTVIAKFGDREVTPEEIEVIEEKLAANIRSRGRTLLGAYT